MFFPQVPFLDSRLCATSFGFEISSTSHLKSEICCWVTRASDSFAGDRCQNADREALNF